uniref:protein-histidine N-methyltransferase n=1 Tax=Dendroctonus ponderosae TaxID=77166 RepID=A0AAR5P617_DENPD
MNMFKFNFASDEEQSTDTVSSKDPDWLESQEVPPGDDNDEIIKNIFTECEQNSVACKETTVKYFSTVDVLNILRTEDDDLLKKQLAVLNADENHSDLQTAVYEGGLKIWECTYDMLSYIAESQLDFHNKNVLDLGCGAGLIGMLCLLKGATCTFQDYNTEVLKYLTIPNVKLNADEKYVSKSKFYSGDWGSFTSLLNLENEEMRFDYIFTAETIYNVDNYPKLHDCFKNLLKQNGEIYVAAKSYYFGVGGGISLFEDYLKSRTTFKSKICWDSSEGLKRQILQVLGKQTKTAFFIPISDSLMGF